jgi:hypothetical protein
MSSVVQERSSKIVAWVGVGGVGGGGAVWHEMVDCASKFKLIKLIVQASY